MDQQPTVGRIVHFAEPRSRLKAGSQVADTITRAAIVTATADTEDSSCVDYQVDLQVFDRSAAGSYVRLTVPFSDQSTPSAGTWFWPKRV
jgi:hypothetical protein